MERLTADVGLAAFVMVLAAGSTILSFFPMIGNSRPFAARVMFGLSLAVFATTLAVLTAAIMARWFAADTMGARSYLRESLSATVLIAILINYYWHFRKGG